MAQVQIMKRWIKRTFILLGVLFGLAALALGSLHYLGNELMEAKSARELTAIVRDKRYRKFEKENAVRTVDGEYFYLNEEGTEVQRDPGDDEWLIIYEVEQFDPSQEPFSSRLLTEEKKRIANGKLRACDVRKSEYEQINIGSRVYVTYQAFSDLDVMAWNCSRKSFAERLAVR